jgi:predicted dehydrogenase
MSEPSGRRRFLRKTIAAAAAASAWPAASSANGIDAQGGWEEFLDDASIPQASPRTPLGPGDPVRIGVIGTGGMGTSHCEAFAKLASAGHARVSVDAVSDVCQPRMMGAKQKVDAIQKSSIAAYTDYRELLRRTDLHGVLVASPEHWHGRMCEEAIEAGKDVLVEKPMTLTLKDALRLRKVVQKNPDVIFLVGTQFVMMPSYKSAQAFIAEGAIGKPVWSQTSYCRNSKQGEWTYYEIDPAWKPGENLDWNMWCGPSGKAPWNPEVYARWRRYKRYSTGIIGDLLVHQITPMIKAMNLGWPVRVTASGGHYVDKKMQNHDQVNLTVEFEDEHTMVVAGSTCNELGLDRVIHGHKGNLYVGGPNAVLRPERLYAEEVQERQIDGPAEPGLGDHDKLRLHWLSAIRNRERPESDIELGTKVMVIVDLATRSMWERAAFGYDPERQKVKKL